MSKFKLSKLKLIAVSLLVCVVALAAGGSIAYFSDSKATTDVFSVGSVSVSLTQSAIKEDAQGNMILDPEKPKIEGGELSAVKAYRAIEPEKRSLVINILYSLAKAFVTSKQPNLIGKIKQK